MNKGLSICFFIVLSFLSIEKGQAQFAAHFNNYWDLASYYNPGYVGHSDQLNIVGTYSMQLANFEHSPRTMFFAADMPVSFLGRKHGIGLGLYNDALGLFKNQQIGLQYAFKHAFKKGRLGAGIYIGLLNLSYNPEDLNLGDQSATDPAFPSQEENAMGLDLGFGVYYNHPLFYLGISGQHLTSPKLNLSTDDTGKTSMMSIKPMLYFTGGYNIHLRNPLIFIQPSLLVQTDLKAVRADLTGRFFYTHEDKTFYGGITYSPKISVGFCFGARIKGISLGYVYELYTSKIGLSGGSHDLVVGYSMDINLFKKGKNKHKSIRIL